jgi:citrate synthase
MSQEDLYMTAEEAAKALDVTVATLYAYVSRKQIRSEKMEGSRARRYWRADIERMRGHAPTAAEPAASELSARSSITLITDGGLYFRGHDAVELAKTRTLESVAALMWKIDEATLFQTPASEVPEELPAMRAELGRHVGLLEYCAAFFPLIERANPRAYDLSPAGYARTGVELIRWVAAFVSHASKPSVQPLHTVLAKGLKVPPGGDELIRALLVLSADHEFSPITHAVRAVANVGVTAYQAVTVGLIASRGQRFQAERYGSALGMLQEILIEKDGAAAVIKRLRNGQPLSGFLTSDAPGDPRTAALLAVMSNALPRDRDLARLLQAQRAARETAGVEIDFILPAIFVGHRLGLAGEELAITAVGRMVGWIAHAMEQYHENELVRVRVAYTGPLP